jgi:RNA-directed DNA polymerase
MTNGHGKSDSAIVAGEADEQSRETGRGAGGAKGGGQGECEPAKHVPAQDRESVSQAVERIRQVARQRKKERFTSLFHHLGIALLRRSFFAFKR